MWPFKKKTPEWLNMSWLGADMHSHLIPGVDDGARDLSASLEMIRGLSAMGYKKIITTPHILWEIYPNTAEIIKTGLAEVQAAVAAEGLPVTLSAAAEYYIDEHFEEQLRNKVPLLPISGNMVLVEFSLVTAPLDLLQVLFQMQVENYQPVIAHPERYIYLQWRKDFFESLKDAGCYFQLNLLSLTGHYGAGVQDLANYLLKKGYYNFAGTDMHTPKQLAALQKIGSSPLFAQLKDAGLMNRAL